MYEKGERKLCVYLKRDEGIQHRNLWIVRDKVGTHRTYKIEHRGDYHLLNTQGVAVMMSKKHLSHLIVGREPGSARQMFAKFKISHKRIALTVFTCSALTHDADEEETDPREDPGVKSRMCHPYPQRVVKGN